jgi:acyl-CoA thioester hydrolase
MNMKRACYPQEIRFSDVDMMGHVNNSVYLTYFEEARMKFMMEITPPEWSWVSQGIIVARNEINYRMPVLLGDPLFVVVEVCELGRTSFTLSYQLLRNDQLCSDGKSIMVCFDYNEKTKITIPDHWREALIRN